MTSRYLDDLARSFRVYKALGEAALAQTSDVDLFTQIDEDANSIATIVKHLGGNFRSRFRDFLTTDGEKPDRDRDGEFVPSHTSRAEVVRDWETGWTTVMAAIETLEPEDLDRTVHIRGESFLVMEALNRSITHTAYHVGQIVLLAKHFAGPTWKSLSIPKGQSKQYTTGAYKQGVIPRR